MKSYEVRNMFNMILSIFVMSLISAGSYASSVTVLHPYVRAVPHGQINSAAFMILKNASSQDLSLVKANSNISKNIELHNHINENGILRMRQIEKISIGANSETVLKPGGLHVMFIGLKKELNEGDMVEFELEFDNGEIIKLTAPVKKVAGMHMKGMHK